MKGNKKLLIVAVLLLLIAVSYGTYAIYRTKFEASATVKTAKWSAVLKKGSTEVSTLNFTLADFNCGGNAQHGKNGTIAPGDTCTLPLTVDLDESEVDAEITATIGTVTGTIESSRFTVALMDGSTDVSGTAIDVPYSATAGAMEKTLTLTLTWLGDTDDLAANGKDVKDVSMQGQTDLTIPVTIDAHQDMGA